jgi:hypothetical protein
MQCSIDRKKSGEIVSMPAAIIVSASMVTVDDDTPFVREAIGYVLQFELLRAHPKKGSLDPCSMSSQRLNDPMNQ